MNNQYFNVRPITCPRCGNTELAYVTEAHKCLGFRITNMILSPFIILSLIIGIIQAITYDASSAIIRPGQSQSSLFVDTYIFIIIAVMLSIIFVVFQVLIFVNESKTHVCAICSKCGTVWNIN